MNKTNLGVFFILLLLSMGIIVFGQSHIVLSIGHYLNEILKPFESIISNVRNFLFFWQNAFLNIKTLKESNIKLASENLELYGKLKNISLLEEENSVLKEQLNLLNKGTDIKLAKIISRDYQNDRVFIIDKGTNDGVANGMAIISKGEVVIGRIIDASYSTSKVQTILDVQTKIAAVTLDSRVFGLAHGLGSDIMFDLVAKNKNLKKGELVISSGTDEIWPRGLIIGKIGEIKLMGNQVFNSATIEALVNIKELMDIFVIINK